MTATYIAVSEKNCFRHSAAIRNQICGRVSNCATDVTRALDEEYISRVATNLEEDQKQIEAGFEYVTDRNGAKICRKRK